MSPRGGERAGHRVFPRTIIRSQDDVKQCQSQCIPWSIIAVLCIVVLGVVFTDLTGTCFASLVFWPHFKPPNYCWILSPRSSPYRNSTFPENQWGQTWYPSAPEYCYTLWGGHFSTSRNKLQVLSFAIGLWMHTYISILDIPDAMSLSYETFGADGVPTNINCSDPSMNSTGPHYSSPGVPNGRAFTPHQHYSHHHESSFEHNLGPASICVLAAVTALAAIVYLIVLPLIHGDGPGYSSVPWRGDDEVEVRHTWIPITNPIWWSGFHLGGNRHDPLGIYNWAKSIHPDSDPERSKSLKLWFRIRFVVRATQLCCKAATAPWVFMRYSPMERWLRISGRRGWRDDAKTWLVRATEVLDHLPQSWSKLEHDHGVEALGIVRSELAAAFMSVNSRDGGAAQARPMLINEEAIRAVESELLLPMHDTNYDGRDTYLTLGYVNEFNSRLFDLGVSLTLPQVWQAWRTKRIPGFHPGTLGNRDPLCALLCNTFLYGSPTDRTRMLREMFMNLEGDPQYASKFSNSIVRAIMWVCRDAAASTGGSRSVVECIVANFLDGRFHFFPTGTSCIARWADASGRTLVKSDLTARSLLKNGDKAPLENDEAIWNPLLSWTWRRSRGGKVALGSWITALVLQAAYWIPAWAMVPHGLDWFPRVFPIFNNNLSAAIVTVVIVIIIIAVIMAWSVVACCSSRRVASRNRYTSKQVLTRLCETVIEWKPDFHAVNGLNQPTLGQALVGWVVERRVQGADPASDADPSLNLVFTALGPAISSILEATDAGGRAWIHTVGQRFASGELEARETIAIIKFFFNKLIDTQNGNSDKVAREILATEDKSGETVAHCILRGVPGPGLPTADQAKDVCEVLLGLCPELRTKPDEMRPRDFADTLALSECQGGKSLLRVFETRLFERYRLVGLNLNRTTYTSATARVYECQDMGSCNVEGSRATTRPRTVILKLMRLPEAWRRELGALRAIKTLSNSHLYFILPESAATCDGGEAGIQEHGIAIVNAPRVLADNTVGRQYGGGDIDVISEINTDFQQGICMPKGDRDLQQIISRERLATQPIIYIQRIVLDLLEGIATLHGAELRHGDVKPLNVLLHDDRYKLIDFDMCVQRGTPMNRIERRKLLGSSAYLPPELYHYAIGAAGPEHGTSAPVRDDSWDLWGLGCTLYEMVSSGTPIFPKREHGNGNDQISELGQMLLDKLFYKQTRFKHLAEQIKSISCNRSQFETEVIVDFLDKLLEPDPAKRMRVEEAQAHRFCSYSTFEITSPVAPKPTADLFAAAFDQFEDDLNAVWTDDEATEVFKKAATMLENVLREVCAAQSTALEGVSTLGQLFKVVSDQTWCPFDRAHVLQDDLQKLLKHRNSCVHDRMSIMVVYAKKHVRTCKNMFQALSRARCFEPKGPTELSEIFATDLDEYDTELQHAQTSANATEWFKKAATTLENMLREVCTAKRVQFRPGAGLGALILAIYKEDWCPFDKTSVTKASKHGAFEKLLDHRNSCTHDGMSIPIGTARAHMLLCKKVLRQLTEASCFEPAAMYPGTIDFSGQLLAVAFKDGQQRPVRRLRDGPTYELTIPATAAGKLNFGFRISHKSDSNARDYQVDGVDASWWAAGFIVQHDRSSGATKLVASGGLGELACTLA